MKIYENFEDYKPISKCILTIGNFDGVHRGHKAILKSVTERAKALKLPSALLTFSPHPVKVLRKNINFPLITPFEKKIELIKAEKIDILFVADFSEAFSKTSPVDFIEKIILKFLKPKEIWVGSNYAFGRNKSGDIALLSKEGDKHGFSVMIYEPFKISGEMVSSSAIREQILNGDVKKAGEFLGRPYCIRGVVESGKGKGGELGFKTANLKTEFEIIPKDGVYACFAKVKKKIYKAAVNIGFTPTIPSSKRAIEAYLMDFDEDISGAGMSLYFIERIRDEKKFKNIEELKKRIGEDVKEIFKILVRMEDVGNFG